MRPRLPCAHSSRYAPHFVSEVTDIKEIYELANSMGLALL